MKPGARIQAAAEIIDDVIERHRPAAEALADWGKTHRFAGSGDRAALGTLVFDALRRRRSLAAQMGAETGRALALAAAMGAMGLDPNAASALADGSAHALAPLTAEEQAALGRELGVETPWDVRADLPAWIAPSFLAAFGERALAEGQALAKRAPIDLRVNGLKADRDRVLKALSAFGAVPTPWSPDGVRIAPPTGLARAANVEAETGHGKGWYEVQDEGSQIAARMAAAGPRMQVLDLCAGAGGKTLALASGMQNTGQIYAYDADKSQLRPIFERLKRAGVRSVQVLPAGDETGLTALGPRFDVVFVDAPCTGSGVWRRRPDSKWRVRSTAVAERGKQQRHVLSLSQGLVKPGGRIVYVTCSMLPEENGAQVQWFLEQAPDFTLVPYRDVWARTLDVPAPESADGGNGGLQLSPAQHGTDGFFIAVLARAG